MICCCSKKGCPAFKKTSLLSLFLSFIFFFFYWKLQLLCSLFSYIVPLIASYRNIIFLLCFQCCMLHRPRARAFFMRSVVCTLILIQSVNTQATQRIHRLLSVESKKKHITLSPFPLSNFSFFFFTSSCFVIDINWPYWRIFVLPLLCCT